MKLNKNYFYHLKKKKKVFIIAEAGSNHEGSLIRAYKLVDIAKKAGADAVKFQSFVADEIATKNEKYNRINKKFKKYGKNLHDFYKKFQLPSSFNKKIHDYCKKKKIIFMSSVFGDESLKITSKLNPVFKVASFEANYFELLDKLTNKKKFIIVSTGCSDEKEILKIKNFFQIKKYKHYSILHCGSSYPLKFKDANLNYIKKLKKIFNNQIIGYSDHTLGISSCIAAVTLGANIIEKHITISKKDSSPDSFFSADYEELSILIKSIREIEISLGKEKKIITKSINEMKQGKRTYFSMGNYKKGKKIKKNMLKALRPRVEKSISVENYFNIIGKTLKKDIKKNDPLLFEHL
ncbi:N-acetylneuraminate synthase family protein [Candidatus Pelagibacter ubique]|nr:N-acetylneuraminate synthase family protein [Candidatus Pelagibacter ubique]